MKPYFDTNPAAGLLLLGTVALWVVIELRQYVRGRGRQGATRVGGPGWWIAAWGTTIVANIALRLAPHFVPAASIRPGAISFAIGLVVLLAGIALRGWSFRTLGQYFTFSVMVSSDQPVITTGPYGLLRHPSYSALLLASTGVGLMSANWAGLAALVLLTLAVLIWRIKVEETALLATLDDRYSSYAARHKRLVPFVW